MLSITKDRIEIQRPLQEVFNYCSNMENYKNWYPGVIELQSLNELPHGAEGKTYSEIIEIPFKGRVNVVIEVTDSQKDKSFTTQADIPGLLPRITMEFSEAPGGGTLVQRELVSRETSLLSGIYVFLFRRTAKKAADKGLERLKAILEKIK